MNTLTWLIILLAVVIIVPLLVWLAKLKLALKIATANEQKLIETRDYLEANLQEITSKMEQRKSELFHQSKMATIGEMMENIAHQWRQPLSQINSAVLLVDDALSEKEFRDIMVEEKLLEIESLTKYMSKTIDDFRNFFDDNKIKEDFSLKQLIDESIYIVQGTLKEHHIDIQFELEHKYIYTGFPRELQQVIVIILNNAKDAFLRRKIFSPKIVLTVQKENEQYIITICDNAGGIKKDMLDTIFDPYITTKHKSQGTDLGLYISKMIIHESMNGELIAYNSDNGACFEIRLKADNDEISI